MDWWVISITRSLASIGHPCSKEGFMRFHRGRLFALTVAALTAAGTVHVSPLTAHARPIPGASPAAVVNSHGVRMALTIPKRSYPRDSLVQVTLRLRNVSRHAVLVSTNNGPSVQVLDGAGHGGRRMPSVRATASSLRLSWS